MKNASAPHSPIDVAKYEYKGISGGGRLGGSLGGESGDGDNGGIHGGAIGGGTTGGSGGEYSQVAANVSKPGSPNSAVQSLQT